MTDVQQMDRVMRSLPTVSALCLTGNNPEVFRSVLDRIGDRWSMLIIGVLSERPHRFTELAGVIPGISRRMLTSTLRALERDGLARREVFAEVPVKVEYSVTELGLSLSAIVRDLAHWAALNQASFVTNRETYDTHHPAQ